MTKKEKSEKKDQKDLKIDELTDMAQRLQADFENYRKRVDQEKVEFTKFACSQVIEQIIPIVDNFELALQHTKAEDEFTKGVELIFSQLVQMLEDNGVTPINPQPGDDFNAHEHEALLAEESKKKANTILEVLQKGYKIEEKIIRHAKVKVSK